MNHSLAPVQGKLHAPTPSSAPTQNMWSQPRFYTSQEWDDQRLEITRLYTTENKPLKDIVEIMKKKYLFCATERQYKTRISQWSLEKNVKFDEMKVIVRKYSQRKVQQGKDTHFRVRKRPVDPRKISRFIKKHKISDGWYSSRSFSKSSTPSDISYSTVHHQTSGDISMLQQGHICSTDTPGRSKEMGCLSYSERSLPNRASLSSKSNGTNFPLQTGNGIEKNTDEFKRHSLSKDSQGDLSGMREFFDFSTAAKSDVKSISNIVLGRNATGSAEAEGREGQEINSDIESENNIPETLDTLSELAGQVEDQGMYEWSRVLLQRVIRLHRQTSGNDHPTALSALEALSRVLRRQGRYSEAERLLSGALKAFQKTRGDMHADTLDCMGLLALVMMYQGRYSEAEMLARNALDIRSELLDINDVALLRSKEKLGIVLAAQGDHMMAEELHRDVLSARWQRLGEDHQTTLNGMHNLAIALEGQEKYEEMESIYQNMLEVQTRTLGADHAYTLTSMHGVAVALGGQKRYKEAEWKYRQVIALRRKISGNEHPHTLTSMHNLAGILQDQGLYEEAARTYQEVLDIEGRTLGPEHPSTLTTQANLTTVLLSLGEDDKAEAMSRKTLASREKVLGVEHPSTLISRVNLARLLEDKGEYGEATRLYQDVLVVRQKVLGSNHPLTRKPLRRLRRIQACIREAVESGESDDEA